MHNKTTFNENMGLVPACQCYPFLLDDQDLEVGSRVCVDVTLALFKIVRSSSLHFLGKVTGLNSSVHKSKMLKLL